MMSGRFVFGFSEAVGRMARGAAAGFVLFGTMAAPAPAGAEAPEAAYAERHMVAAAPSTRRSPPRWC
jgi:hypothetical protein